MGTSSVRLLTIAQPEVAMCFSPEADLAAGVVIGAIGIDALRHVTRRAELPLACLPLLLASHSLIETSVWWGQEAEVPQAVGRLAIFGYLVIAFGVLPVLIPSAVAALEPEGNRARMALFTTLGVGVAATLMYAVVRGPTLATIQHHHIDYSVDLWHGGVIAAFYVVATCGPMLASRHVHIRWFGCSNLVAATVLSVLDRSAFVSLWCVWAALTSVAIAIQLRSSPRPLSRELASDRV